MRENAANAAARRLADVLNIGEIKNLGISDEHLDRNENHKFQAVRASGQGSFNGSLILYSGANIRPSDAPR
jgi:hypothetical protein